MVLGLGYQADLKDSRRWSVATLLLNRSSHCVDATKKNQVQKTNRNTEHNMACRGLDVWMITNSLRSKFDTRVRGAEAEHPSQLLSDTYAAHLSRLIGSLQGYSPNFPSFQGEMIPETANTNN
jgi:hypothetical protein